MAYHEGDWQKKVEGDWQRIRMHGQVPLLGVRIESWGKRCGGFYWCVGMALGHSQGGTEWQGPDLSHWSTCSPQWAPHSLFVGMLKTNNTDHTARLTRLYSQLPVYSLCL